MKIGRKWNQLPGEQMTSYVWRLHYIDDLVLCEKGAERLYSLADPNWNVAALVDASGAVVERMKYDAFGKVTWLDGSFGAKAASDYGWNRTFTRQVLDVETGLMLYRNRYYHTGLGRFISVDPLEYDGWDVNLYRYVHNQPGIYFDPFGEKFWSLKDWWDWLRNVVPYVLPSPASEIVPLADPDATRAGAGFAAHCDLIQELANPVNQWDDKKIQKDTEIMKKAAPR